MPEELEKKLKAEVKNKKWSKERKNAYVYGTMRRVAHWKPSTQESLSVVDSIIAKASTAQDIIDALQSEEVNVLPLVKKFSQGDRVHFQGSDWTVETARKESYDMRRDGDDKTITVPIAEIDAEAYVIESKSDDIVSYLLKNLPFGKANFKWSDVIKPVARKFGISEPEAEQIVSKVRDIRRATKYQINRPAVVESEVSIAGLYQQFTGEGDAPEIAAEKVLNIVSDGAFDIVEEPARSAYIRQVIEKHGTQTESQDEQKEKKVKCTKCGDDVWDIAQHNNLAKCWSCGTRFYANDADDSDSEEFTERMEHEIDAKLKPAPKGPFKKSELEKGTEDEMEHTRSKKTAEVIAKQHLSGKHGNPSYYSDMEKAGLE